MARPGARPAGLRRPWQSLGMLLFCFVFALITPTARSASVDAPDPPAHIVGRASNESACVILIAPVNVGPGDAVLTKFTLLAVPRPPGKGPTLVTRGARHAGGRRARA